MPPWRCGRFHLARTWAHSPDPGRDRKARSRVPFVANPRSPRVHVDLSVGLPAERDAALGLVRVGVGERDDVVRHEVRRCEAPLPALDCHAAVAVALEDEPEETGLGGAVAVPAPARRGPRKSGSAGRPRARRCRRRGSRNAAPSQAASARLGPRPDDEGLRRGTPASRTPEAQGRQSRPGDPRACRRPPSQAARIDHDAASMRMSRSIATTRTLVGVAAGPRRPNGLRRRRRSAGVRRPVVTVPALPESGAGPA